MYEIAHRNYLSCEKNVEDNMVKQAKTVMKISKEDFDKYFKDFDVKQEVGDISKSISRQLAEDYLVEWKRAKDEIIMGMNGGDLETGNKPLLHGQNPEELLLMQKDRLFVNTGEDVEDIFAAFKYYKLDYE